MSSEFEAITQSELPSVKEGASLFASKEWSAVIGEGLQAYALKSASGEIRATCLLFHSEKMGMGYTITSPFAPHIGLSMYLNSQKVASRQSRAKEIHKAVASLLEEHSGHLTEVALGVDVVDSQAYTWAGFDVSPRHTYHIELSRSETELLDAMKAERRKNIRKAQEGGVVVEAINDVDRFLKVIEKTIARQGIPMDKGIFERLLSDPGLEPYRKMYMASKDGVDLAASLVVHDEKQAYYLIGGYDPEQAHEGAGTLNLWTAILDAKARGNQVFDLEGSMIPEVERYFRGFGGELKTFFSIKKKSLVGRIASKIKGRG